MCFHSTCEMKPVGKGVEVQTPFMPHHYEIVQQKIRNYAQVQSYEVDSILLLSLPSAYTITFIADNHVASPQAPISLTFESRGIFKISGKISCYHRGEHFNHGLPRLRLNRSFH